MHAHQRSLYWIERTVCIENKLKHSVPLDQEQLPLKPAPRSTFFRMPQIKQFGGHKWTKKLFFFNINGLHEYWIWFLLKKSSIKYTQPQMKVHYCTHTKRTSSWELNLFHFLPPCLGTCEGRALTIGLGPHFPAGGKAYVPEGLLERWANGEWGMRKCGNASGIFFSF